MSGDPRSSSCNACNKVEADESKRWFGFMPRHHCWRSKVVTLYPRIDASLPRDPIPMADDRNPHSVVAIIGRGDHHLTSAFWAGSVIDPITLLAYWQIFGGSNARIEQNYSSSVSGSRRRISLRGPSFTSTNLTARRKFGTSKGHLRHLEPPNPSFCAL